MKRIIEILKWETPEQYEKRAGEPWPDDGTVYYRCYYIRAGVKNFLMANEWRTHIWGKIKNQIRKGTQIAPGYDIEVVCATEAGPPPYEWPPEG
jgi:hypothetical protein